jgi:hypothetical protein
MSIEWSAGDIATAIKIAYELIEMQDSCDGAVGNYRKAVGSLRDLTRTLNPLRIFTAREAFSTYDQHIQEQMKNIRESIEKFLKDVLKYEPSLGIKAAEDHHPHVLRKLQWHMFMPKNALGLRSQMESHMRITDTLVHRLTLCFWLCSTIDFADW